MRTSNRLGTILVAVGLLAWSAAPLAGRTKNGDKFLALGRKAEQLEQFDDALDLYKKALAEDPTELAYQMALKRVRFQAGQTHVDLGEKLRSEGKLEEALAEFGMAYSIDPSSPIAKQELQRTIQMIEREKEAAERGEPQKKEERGLTPAEAARRKAEQKLKSLLPVPELKPLSSTPITLKMNNQPPKVVFETIGKLAGVNVVFDPDYAQQAQPRSLNVDLTNATLEEALNYVSIMTKSFWKPLSANAVFVTTDVQNKRREYEDHVAKVFYLTNVTTQQELTEISSTLRTVGNIQRVFHSQSQSALIVKGTADQVALAELLIHQLDRPRSEVVVDVIVMEVNRARSRDLAAGIASGINIPIVFTPRNPVLQGTQNGDGDGTGGSTQSTLISLAQIGRISTNDYSVTLPGAVLEAIMSDRGTKVLQSPQVRAVDGQKASLKIGDRVPYSTGGFQPAFGQVGTGFNSLYSSFQFLDVGVNVDITPKVHNSDEVSLHIELDISNVRDRIDIGGISQPVVGQSKVVHDIRLREGEVSLLGGLMQTQETKAVSGVPGLSSIPVIRRLFTGESIEKNESELLIAIVPHIVRTPALDELSFKGVAVGTDQAVKLSYAPRKPAAEPVEAPKPPAAPPEEAAPAPPKPKPEAPAGPPAAPAAAARVVFNPATIEAQTGATFTVNLQVENVSDLFSVPLRIKFDQNLLRLNEITRGTFLSGDGREVIFTRNILNDTGDATVNLGRMPGTGGISGSGTLVTLSFQAVRGGAASVSALKLTLQNSQAQPILTASPQLVVNIK